MNKNERVVTEFIEAFGRMNADELIEYFTDAAVYHNVPLPVQRGRQQIYDGFKGLARRFQAVRVEIVNQVSAGNIVMNERIDILP